MNTLKELYNKEIKPELKNKFNYSSTMEIPKLEKIVINIGVGDGSHDEKLVEAAKADLEASSVWSQIRAVKEGNVTILDASPYFSQAYNPIGRELILESVKDSVIE